MLPTIEDTYAIADMIVKVKAVSYTHLIYGDEDPLPVIFQSGYLTIKEYDPRFGPVSYTHLVVSTSSGRPPNVVSPIVSWNSFILPMTLYV